MNPNYISKNLNSYCGLLHQVEFAERYKFIYNRTVKGYSRDDLAFLLGRPSFDVKDYEEFCDKITLNGEDLKILEQVFENVPIKNLGFDKKEIQLDIRYIKRQVRVNVTQVGNIIVHKFLVPWTIEKKKEPIEIIEFSYDPSKDNMDERKSVFKTLADVFEANYFNEQRTPLEIYKKLAPIIGFDFRPCYLKEAIYCYVRDETIIARGIEGSLYFKNKPDVS